MSNELFAGLDVSTQSCKLVVIDYAKETVVFIDSVNYDTDLPHFDTKEGIVRGLGHGVSESDPRMWLEAVNEAFFRLKKSGAPMDSIRCISVSGQQHGLVSLDASGSLTRPRSKLWNDFSTLDECSLLTKRVGGKKAMIREVGNSQRTGYTASKIFHMFRHETDNYRKTATFFVVHNYINWYLTGGPGSGVRVMEPGDTAGTALWNPKTGQWSKKVLTAIDPDLEKKLPPVLSAKKTIGFISQELADRCGFSLRCRIDAGSGDNMYGAVGTGNVAPGIVTVSLGTSGTACAVLNEPFIDPTGEIAAYCDSTGRYLSLLCVSNLANGYNQILRQFRLSHEEFDNLIRETSPGNQGRLIIPWFTGERTPDVPLASPVSLGFGLEDFKPPILCRSVLEGHVLNLYDGFRRMPVESQEIRLTGGLSQSESWCQAIADIFETDAVPVEGEGAALGAAIHAAWVWLNESGKKTPIQKVADRFVKLDEKRRKKPTLGHQKIYRAQKKLYQALTDRLLKRNGEDPFALLSLLRKLADKANR